MIRLYLSDTINDNKTLQSLKVHLSNEVFDFITRFGEWKIKLTTSIKFYFF